MNYAKPFPVSVQILLFLINHILNFLSTGNKSLCRAGAEDMNYNIVNEIKLTYTRIGNSEKIITSSRDAVKVFRQHFDSDEIDYRESFYALYLNQANKVLGIKKSLNAAFLQQLLT